MRYIIFLAFLIFSLTANLFAELNKIVVSSNRLEEPEQLTTQKVLVFEEEDLKTYSGFTLGDFLKNLNTSHIHDYPGVSTSFSLRGLRSDTHGIDLRGRVLLTINGRRAGTGNASLIPMSNVEKIEIISGTSAVQYGSAAMGGVINVITKNVVGKPELFLEYEAGSFDHYGVTLGGSGEAKGLDFSFSMKNAKTDSYNTSEGKYPETDTGKKSGSLNVGYTSNLGRIGIVYNISDTGDIGYNNKFDYTKANLQLYTDNSQRKKLTSYDIVYSGKTENLRWNLKFFKGKDEKTYRDKDKDDYWGSSSVNYYETKFYGYQGNIQSFRKIYEATLGFDYNKYDTKNRNSDNVAPYSPDSEYSDLGFFVIPKLKLLNDKLILSVGMRYDKYNLKIKETPLRTVLKKDEDIHNTIYSGGIRYNFTKNFSVRGNYSEGFVIPQADQLNADYSVWATPYKGNPDLKPEKSKTYELGIDYDNNIFSGFVTFFRTDYTDKIITKSYGSYKSWINSGESIYKGVEFEVRYDIGGHFKNFIVIEPYMSFIYFDTFKDKENDEKMLYVSRFQGSYGIFVTNTPEDFYARLNVAYTGRQRIDDYDPFTYTTTRKDKKSFSLATLTVGKRVYNSKKYGQLHFSAEIDNLFNKEYSYVEGYLMPERNYRASIRYAYKF